MAREHGYALLVGKTRRDPASEQQRLKHLEKYHVGGTLMAPMMPLDAVYAFAQRAGIPVVVYGRTAPISVLPHAVLRFTRATEEAIDHLLELGHRHIGLRERGCPATSR